MDEKNNQNIVNFSFVIAGFIAFFIAGVLLEVLAGSFRAMANLRDQDMVRHGLPVAIGFAVFLFLITNRKIKTWADEVVTEVGKVVWPSRKDTIAMTIVCCVMVLAAGMGLGLFDLMASQLIKLFVTNG